jgi:hypothetical protein
MLESVPLVEIIELDAWISQHAVCFGKIIIFSEVYALLLKDIVTLGTVK